MGMLQRCQIDGKPGRCQGPSASGSAAGLLLCRELELWPSCPALQISLSSAEEHACERFFLLAYPRQYILASIYTYKDRLALSSVSCCAVPRTTEYPFHSPSQGRRAGQRPDMEKWDPKLLFFICMNFCFICILCRPRRGIHPSSFFP